MTQKRMQDQHKGMLKRLRDGLFDNLPESAALPCDKGRWAWRCSDGKSGSGRHQDRRAEVDADAAGAKAEASSPIISPVPPPPSAPNVSTSTLAERLKKLNAAAAPAAEKQSHHCARCRCRRYGGRN